MEVQVRYRNRLVLLASVAGIAAQPAIVAYLVLVDNVGSDEVLDLVALLSMASLFAWFCVRVGIQPLIVCEGSTIVVRNPLLSYQAQLSEVQFLAKGGVSPCFSMVWVMYSLGCYPGPSSTVTKPARPGGRSGSGFRRPELVESKERK